MIPLRNNLLIPVLLFLGTIVFLFFFLLSSNRLNLNPFTYHKLQQFIDSSSQPIPYSVSETSNQHYSRIYRISGTIASEPKLMPDGNHIFILRVPKSSYINKNVLLSDFDFPINLNTSINSLFGVHYVNDFQINTEQTWKTVDTQTYLNSFKKHQPIILDIYAQLSPLGEELRNDPDCLDDCRQYYSLLTKQGAATINFFDSLSKPLDQPIGFFGTTTFSTNQ